ncbi:hypothetical protein J1N35_008161 [Gossypium stocksii]|uniref:Uncharacterized protein n=1 Tax=Gossypium stocksii TaxID=47602 RepID=A0A9D3W9W2_9ROSI|nr:hypothetical protein J1N35_008161 [Gossypium stocksii]
MVEDELTEKEESQPIVEVLTIENSNAEKFDEFTFSKLNTLLVEPSLCRTTPLLGHCFLASNNATHEFYRSNLIIAVFYYRCKLRIVTNSSLLTRSSKTSAKNPIVIQDEKMSDTLNWNYFCDTGSLPDKELVREFYANLTMPDATKVPVCKKKVPLTSKSINDLFNLPDVEEDEYFSMMTNIN